LFWERLPSAAYFENAAAGIISYFSVCYASPIPKGFVALHTLSRHSNLYAGPWKSILPITTIAFPITRLVVLCRLRFFPEHGQRNRERGFQNRQRQQLHKELNSIAASKIYQVRASSTVGKNRDVFLATGQILRETHFTAVTSLRFCMANRFSVGCG
jgi:hypothetical protein